MDREIEGWVLVGLVALVLANADREPEPVGIQDEGDSEGEPNPPRLDRILNSLWNDSPVGSTQPL